MLPELHAERQLAAIEAAAVPYMTQSAAQETIGKYTRAAGRAPARARTLGEALAQIPMRRVAEPKET